MEMITAARLANSRELWCKKHLLGKKEKNVSSGRVFNAVLFQRAALEGGKVGARWRLRRQAATDATFYERMLRVLITFLVPPLTFNDRLYHTKTFFLKDRLYIAYGYTLALQDDTITNRMRPFD